jgi:opacity protein-like surface antigen
MRKNYVFLLVLIFMAGTLNAQKYYARLGIGAGFGLSYYSSQSVNRTIIGNTSDVIESKSGSLGSGLNINLAGGYMFSKYIGVELGFNEFIGFGVKTKYSLTQTGYEQQFDDKYKGMSFQIIPALVLTPGFEKINPYARFGLIIGVVNSTNYSYTNTKTGNPEFKAATTVENYKEKDFGGVALGFAAAIGAEYNLTEMISLYAEVNLNGVNYSPRKGKVLEWTQDGVDQMPLMTTKDKEWEYVKTLDDKVSIPSGSPNQFLKETALLTNVGISIGVKFKFGGAN